MNITEEECRAILEAARWPAGPVCPKCGAEKHACRISTRPGLYTCTKCRSCQYSVTSGTPLHGTRVELAQWIALIKAKAIDDKTLTVSQTSRKLGVSYLTAKTMIERLNALIETRETMFDRIVEGIRNRQQREAA